VPACGPDSTGAGAVLSRRHLRSVDTMETVVPHCVHTLCHTACYTRSILGTSAINCTFHFCSALHSASESGLNAQNYSAI